MNASVARAGGQHTYASFGDEGLQRLWWALRGEQCPTSVRERFAWMLAPWGDRLLPRRAAWRSDIGDDHSPFELSVVFSAEGSEVRLLVEAQGEEPTLHSTTAAALRLTDALATRGANLKRFHKVSDLFLDVDDDALFSLWHATSLEGDGTFKAYFNPRGSKKQDSIERSLLAFDRLGMVHARAIVEQARRSERNHATGFLDQARYFCLDLIDPAEARAKIYLYQPGAHVDHFETLAQLAPVYRQGEATAFCEELLHSRGPYIAHPLCTYLAFTSGVPYATEVTMQLPVRFYCDNDETARQRTSALFRVLGLDPAPFEAALRAIAHRPLEQGSGIVTHVSLRLGDSAPRIAVYFAVEAFHKSRPISGLRRVG